MSTINAQTIITEVLAAHAIAPEECTPNAFVKFQTSARGSHRILNCKENLQRFADLVRKNAAAFGGGLIREEKARPSVIYASKTISLYKQLIEDKDWYAALQLADEKLNPLFYFGNDGKAHIQVAQIPLEADSRLVSVLNEDGTWSVIDPVSMMAMHGHASKNKRSRDAQIENAMQRYSKGTQEAKANMFTKAYEKPVDQGAARAQWMAEHGIVDDAAIESRIEAQAAQDVAGIVAHAHAVSAIAEAMAPSDEAREMVTCEADESEAQSVGIGIAQFINVASNSVQTLRKIDVSRVIDETPRHHREELAAFIQSNRPDLAQEVAEVLEDATPTMYPSGGNAEPGSPSAEFFGNEKPSILGQTFEQWLESSFEANPYKQEYIIAFQGYKNLAMLGACIGNEDRHIPKSELRKAAKAQYFRELMMQPRDAALSLGVWDSVDQDEKVELQKHFYDLDTRIIRRTQEQCKAKAQQETAPVTPLVAISSEPPEPRPMESTEAGKPSTLDDFLAVQKEKMTCVRFSQTHRIMHKRVQYDGHILKAHEFIERIMAEGLELHIKQENKIADMSRLQYFRADNEEQMAHEKRQKEAGKKDVYYAGNIELTYTEYLYAQHIACVATSEAPAAPDVAPIEVIPTAVESPEVTAPAAEPVPVVEIKATTPAAEIQPESVAPVVGTEAVIDFAALAQIATDRSGNQSDIKPLQKMRLIQATRDGWYSVTKNGVSTLEANGYTHEGKKGWVKIINSVVGTEAKDVPTIDSQALIKAGFHPTVASVIERTGISVYGPAAQAEIMEKLESVKTPIDATPDDHAKFNIRAKSGAWFACVYMIGAMYGLRFEAADGHHGCTTYSTHADRMQALEAMARATTPPDTPPDGGQPIATDDAPTEAPTPPVAECTPGATVAVRRAKPEHDLQVGDVVRSSWGYDQTNVNHYQIIALIGKRTVEVRELAEHEESTGDMSGRVAPVWGEFVGEAMRRTVDKYGDVNILREKFGRASKIEPVAIVHGVRCYASTGYSSYA